VDAATRFALDTFDEFRQLAEGHNQLEIAIIEWIDWYNHRRLHCEIGDLPPTELESNWYRRQDLAPAAGNP